MDKFTITKTRSYVYFKFISKKKVNACIHQFSSFGNRTPHSLTFTPNELNSFLNVNLPIFGDQQTSSRKKKNLFDLSSLAKKKMKHSSLIVQFVRKRNTFTLI